MKKNLIKSEKTIFILLGIIAIILSSIIAFFLRNNTNLYDFVKVYESPLGNNFNNASKYYDLNNDGSSEIIPIGYTGEQENYYIQICNLSGSVKAQYNFDLTHPYYKNSDNHHSWLTVNDWDNDGVNVKVQVKTDF